MRICHQSDSHGVYLPVKGRCIDAIIHSGDLLPDPDISKGSKKSVVSYWQEKYVLDSIETFKTWIGELPFLFCSGNHDHFSGAELEALLIANGINAICLHDKITHFAGLNIWGAPYVPTINGYHAYEMNTDEMQIKIDAMVKAINEATYVDVIVAHCPPYGILDQDLRNKLHFGNKLMNAALFHTIEQEKVPGHYLTGHCHSSASVQMVSKNGRTILFSNAATASNTLCLDH